MPETDEQVVKRLLEAIRLHRKEYIQGKLDSLTWVRAHRMVIREAEFLGVTDLMLQRGDK